MEDTKKTKAQLLAELGELRKQNALSETSKKGRDLSEKASPSGKEINYTNSFMQAIKPIIDAIPFSIMVIDEDHKILLANQFVENNLENNIEGLLGYSCPKLVHGTDEPFPGCPLEEALEKGQLVEKELLDPLYGKWVSSAIYPLHFKTHDSKLIFLHIVQDISKRKDAQSTILQQNDYLKNIIESFKQPFYVIDAHDYTIKMANSAANFGKLTEKSKCYKLTHHKNKPCNTSHHPCPIDEIKKTKKPFVTEHIHFNKEGDTRIFEVHGYPIINKDGDLDQIIEYTFDITERKMAESKLIESENKFRSIVETVPGLLLISDIEGKNMYVSPNCEEITGYKQEEFQNQNVWWVHEEDTPKAREIYDHSFRKKIGGIAYEYKAVKKNGEIWYASSSWTFLEDKDGNISGMVIQTIDITYRKQMEKKLIKSKMEIETKSKDLEENNIALKVLLKLQDKEKENIERNILANIKTLVFPYIDKIKSTHLENQQKTFINILEKNLSEVIKPFAEQFMNETINLSQTEIQIAGLVKDGKTSKDIADILYISENTVKSHNRHIRSKLGIKHKKVNLRSYLQSFLKNGSR